jgi:hypothetical protein
MVSFPQMFSSGLLLLAIKTTLEVQGDCKWYGQLHKFTGKKVIPTQKSNSRYYLSAQK